MIADTTIKRPALRYYGGKWNLAPWIISHFPPHKNYVEPCGGAASVLLQKPRSLLETYNDLDGNVVNFFRVLRDRPDELIRKIRLTPWARAEYETSRDSVANGDEIEQARRFWCQAYQSISGGPYANKSGWRMSVDANDFLWGSNQYDQFDSIASRFENVQIENDAAQTIIRKYDNQDALIYFDPPYVNDTRSNGQVYRFEFDEVMHSECASLLRQCAGYVVISGYACPLYTELYEAHGWQRFDKEAQTNSGGKRIESLWLSPRTVEALNMPRQSSMQL